MRKQLKKRPRASVYYGTETGSSRQKANVVHGLLSLSHHAVVKNISECSLEVLTAGAKNENDIVVFVASTFGNGDAPTDAKKLKLELYQKMKGGSLPLEGLR